MGGFRRELTPVITTTFADVNSCVNSLAVGEIFTTNGKGPYSAISWLVVQFIVSFSMYKELTP